MVEPIDRELYGEFESEARERLRGRYENDRPVLAIALGLDCEIWERGSRFLRDWRRRVDDKQD